MTTADPTLNSPRWIRARDLVRRLGIHRITINRWVKQGRFPPPHKLGNTRSLFWNLAELEAWESKREPVSTPALP